MADSTPTGRHSAKRRRFAPVALVAGVAASAAIALSLTGTLSAFTAAITNSNDTAASGTLVMQESTAGVTTPCLSTDATPAGNNINTNASTCSTINKYGGSVVLVPNASSTTTVAIKNVGTVPAKTFTLSPGLCTQGTNTVTGNVAGNATDYCGQLGVVVTQTVGGTTTTVTPASSTATSLAPNSATPTVLKPITLTNPVNPGDTVSFTFTVTLNSGAGNAYQGLSASQPLTWQFTS